MTDVLDLERLDSGKAEPHLSPFKPQDFFKRVVNGFQNRAESTGNHLLLTLDDAMPEVLMDVDGSLNAEQPHCQCPQVHIRGKSCTIEWHGGELQMRVSDTGTGISPEDLERILEPFEQAHTVDVNVTNQGVGLGLAITKRLVGLHGGHMEVSSVMGRGTTFVITLNLKEGEIKEAPVANDADGTPAVIPKAPVLIVDDNDLNILVAQRMLSNWGYAVVTAKDSDEAEVMLRETAPFMVLLDIHMPGRNGFEAARDWREADQGWSELPIVGLTADAENRTRTTALESGMNDVVVKPFNPPHMRSILERYALVSRVKAESN